jgi:uncharacterized protein
MPKFVNRERELRALDRACGQQPGLAVVSGRRRVGKTALLDQFARDRRSVFLPGTRAPVSEALARFEQRLREVLEPLPGDLLALGHFTSWDAALGYLIARTADRPLTIVFDEFPYLCEADPALASTLQAHWDHRRDSRLSLVLAGSHVGLMEELVAADAPLFGRADAHLRLLPFAWREAPLLVGGDDPITWIEAWITVGGMPRYLSLWDPRHDALTNLADLLDGPGAPLADEGTVVLQELTPGSSSARLLELAALGAESFTELRSRSGLAPATISEALLSLERLGLVERVTPVGEDPRRTKRVRWQVRDPFLRLWLSVVAPNRDAFELDRGAALLGTVRDRVAASQTAALGDVARDWLGEREQASCGPWWPTTSDETVDALALRGTTPAAAAAARWATAVDGDELRTGIAETLRASPYPRPDQLHVIARDGQQVVRPEDLFVEL